MRYPFNTLKSQLLGLALPLLCLNLYACGPKAFQGRISPAPEWVFTPLEQWDQQAYMQTGEFIIHGQGLSKGQNLISKRRALADANATQDVKKRFVALYTQSLAGAPYREAFIKLISELSWEQIALNNERYFDVEKNQQHTLVSVNETRVIDALNFERSMDQQGIIDWNQVFQSIKAMYQGLKGLKNRNPQ
jgi:hypothetical protein